MKMKKILSVVLAALMLAGVLAGCGGSSSGSGKSGDSIKFTMSMVDNEQSNYYKGAQAIASAVSEKTGGKITIDVKAGGSLGGEADTLDMAIQGDLDIASCANSVLANYIPEMSILDQAFLWDS